MVENVNIVLFEFFEKEMVSPMVLHRRSAMPEGIRKATLNQELVRRMVNTSERVPLADRVLVVDEYAQKLINSEYRIEDAREIIIGGLKGYERLLSLSKDFSNPKWKPLHVAGKFNARNRRVAKLRTKGNWFKGKTVVDQPDENEKKRWMDKSSKRMETDQADQALAVESLIEKPDLEGGGCVHTQTGSLSNTVFEQDESDASLVYNLHTVHSDMVTEESTKEPSKDPVNVVQPDWKSNQVDQGSGIFGFEGVKSSETNSNTVSMDKLTMSRLCGDFKHTKKSSPCATLSRAAHSESVTKSGGGLHRTLTVQSDQVYTAESVCVQEPVCVHQLGRQIYTHAMGVHAGHEIKLQQEEEFTSVQSLIEDWEKREGEGELELDMTEAKPIIRRRSEEFRSKLRVYEGGGEHGIQGGGQHTPSAFLSSEFLNIDKGENNPIFKEESDMLRTVPGRIFDEFLLAELPTNERGDEVKFLSEQRK